VANNIKKNKKTKKVKCETCGKLFDKEQHRINRTKSGKHFCSKECYRKNPMGSAKTGKEISCDYCGSIVYKSLSQLNASKSGKHFCSKECSGKYISESINNNFNVVCDYCDKPFRKSPSSIGKTNFCSRICWEKYIQSDSPSYYRKFKKDKCEYCGLIPINKCQLDIHHNDGNKKNNESENLITLCANCHRLIHYYIKNNILYTIPMSASNMENM